MPGNTIGFLHTLATNQQTFGALLAELDPGARALHRVDEGLLSEARREGADSQSVRRRVGQAVQALADDGAAVVVCTCSTIGPAAEATPLTPQTAATPVMRIDRPMAEQALAFGSRILVAASLASTFQPTLDLLAEVARAANRSIQITRLLCDQAWPLFERGDLPGYAGAIAQAIKSSGPPPEVDVIVLAQASMAPAGALLPDLTTPVLASPRTGVQAALDRLRRINLIEG